MATGMLNAVCSLTLFVPGCMRVFMGACLCVSKYVHENVCGCMRVYVQNVDESVCGCVLVYVQKRR